MCVSVCIARRKLADLDGLLLTSSSSSSSSSSFIALTAASGVGLLEMSFASTANSRRETPLGKLLMEQVVAPLTTLRKQLVAWCVQFRSHIPIHSLSLRLCLLVAALDWPRNNWERIPARRKISITTVDYSQRSTITATSRYAEVQVRFHITRNL